MHRLCHLEAITLFVVIKRKVIIRKVVFIRKVRLKEANEFIQRQQDQSVAEAEFKPLVQT